MHRLLALPLLLVIFPGNADAQSRSGARVEATIGYDRLSNANHYDDLPNTLDGARVGGALGYDLAVAPHLLIGVEADAGWTFDSSETVRLARDRLTQKLGRDLGLSVRVTVPVSGSTALFAKAGYANSRFDHRYRAVVIGGFETLRGHTARSGVRLGAGIEQALSGSLYIKAEYRWTRYDGTTPYMRDPTRNQVLIGFGTHF